jgi:hypothetical protein
MDIYEQKASQLISMVNIALDALNRYPPHHLGVEGVGLMIKFYQSEKEALLNTEPKNRNLKSLKITENDILTFFQEGRGEAVEFFWREIKEKRIPLKRQNMLVKIVKRGKIRNRVEFDLVIDLIVSYQQEGLLNESDVDLLNALIAKFENR